MKLLWHTMYRMLLNPPNPYIWTTAILLDIHDYIYLKKMALLKDVMLLCCCGWTCAIELMVTPQSYDNIKTLQMVYYHLFLLYFCELLLISSDWTNGITSERWIPLIYTKGSLHAFIGMWIVCIKVAHYFQTLYAVTICILSNLLSQCVHEFWIN